ncbi:MAG: hypothetical protein NTX75_18170 [Proteobacteria bacterium]|nr:hypothetical protein [Pseudomonadota bacterium]
MEIQLFTAFIRSGQSRFEAKRYPWETGSVPSVRFNPDSGGTIAIRISGGSFEGESVRSGVGIYFPTIIRISANVAESSSSLVEYNRKPDTLSEAAVSTLDTAIEISGKAYASLFRTISILKLPSEIQAAWRVNATIATMCLLSLPGREKLLK